MSGEEVYTYEPHSGAILRGTGRMRCRYCGLVYLNNVISKWCVKMGCNAALHPGHDRKLAESCGADNNRSSKQKGD
jgi:hypothetical protein